jgi:DNA-directed RNA polymerase
MTSNHDDEQRGHRDRSKPQRIAAPLLSRNEDVRRSATVPGGIEQFRPTDLPADRRERTQLLREFETRAGAYLSAKLSASKAQVAGDPMRNKATRRLARYWSRPLADYIESEAQRSKNKRGPKDKWLAAYNVLGAEALAHCTIEAIVSVLITQLASEDRDKPVHATKVSRAIGHQIERAFQIAEWAKHNPALFAEYNRRLDKEGATPTHRRDVLSIGLNKKARDPATASAELLEATDPWPEVETARIGRWLLFVTEDVTKGAIRLIRRTEGRKSIKAAPYVVELAPKVVKWLSDAVEAQALRATNNRAMVCPPRPWTGPRDGGYLLGDDLRFDTTRMIRAIAPVREAIENDLATDNALKSAEPVFAALNILQATPYGINETVHEIAKQAAASGLKLDDLPAKYRSERVTKQPRTGDSEEDKARHIEWKRNQAKVENSNARNKSKVIWSKSVLAEAAELRDFKIEGTASNGPLWFTHRVDFRGRMYPAGSALNPQGSDLARSLLRFQNGKPIGDVRGPYWLAAQVAKAFGEDKKSWDDRVEWTHENEGLIRSLAKDPLGNRQLWEGEADKIWSALAAAREWANYLDSGRSPTFNTTLPIFIDGTCNGLQHYAALSGNADLARLVNLERGDLPKDIYREIAAAALDDIKRLAGTGNTSKRRPAHLWFQIMGDQPPRKLAKSIVMAKAYGGTFNVIRAAVQEFFDDNEKKRFSEWGRSVDDKEAADLRGWLSKRMDAALKGWTVPADDIMGWLQKAMRLLCDHGVADKLDFKTPTGFPWKNLYFGHTEKDVTTRVNGKKRTMTLAENDTSKFKRDDAVSAIAANFVQSLDAAALMFAVNEAKNRGVTDMMAIHDCIGGLAPDMDIIRDAVRVGFVKCHEAMPLVSFQEAVLTALPAGVKLDPLPVRGDFDVRRVLGSDYFFC